MNAVPITLNFLNQTDADRLAGFSLPRNGTLVGIDKAITGRSGTVNTHTLDINKAGAAVLSGVCAGTANNTRYGWRSTHYGGAEEPVKLVKDSEYNLDVNITGGGNSELTVTLWVLMGEV